MTIKFHPNICNVMMGRGLFSGFSTTSALTIYSGATPLAADIIDNWPTYNSTSSSYLAHYIEAAWSQPSQGRLLALTLPPAVVPTRAGLAAWCIIWSSNIIKAQTDEATLPSDTFIVASVSSSGGFGVVRFNDPNLTLVSTPIADGSIGIISF